MPGVFSGGTYHEVARWLLNFLTAHAKRVDPRIEVAFEDDDQRAGTSYGARLRFGRRLGAPIELAYREVADNRGTLVWCSRLAERTRMLAREVIDQGVADARSG
jgi:hypothetical protein